MKRVFLVVFLLIGVKLIAQDFDKSKLDSLFFLLETNQKGMGSVSIFLDEKEVYHNSYGYSNIENNIKINSETKFRIGSISKMFTSPIILMLIEEGKLSLNTKLSNFFPEIRNADKITIENMLSHRSGIYNFTNSKKYNSYRTKSLTKSQLVKEISDNGSSFKPNKKYKYSNANYVLLSFIAEKIEGIEFKEILKKRICKPCSLNNTYYGSKISDENNEAHSYKRVNDSWNLIKETNMNIPAGAGAIVSNPKDLNIYLNCLFKNHVVSKQSLKMMMESIDGYNFGMMQKQFNNRKHYGHNGGIDGFGAKSYYFPKERVSISYLTNSLPGTTMSMNEVWNIILSIYFGYNYDLPEFTKE